MAVNLFFRTGQLVGAIGRRAAGQWRATSQAFRQGLDGEPRLSPQEQARLAELYAKLELPWGADQEAVDRAFKRLLKQYHPDRYEGDAEKAARATALTQELNQARAELRRHFAER